VLTRLTQLTEKASDTEVAIGSDIMVGAVESHGILKVTGKVAGIDELRQKMSARFTKKSAFVVAAKDRGNIQRLSRSRWALAFWMDLTLFWPYLRRRHGSF
jgi:hypothetical protein